jgi:hypothetical protein
MNIAVQAEIGIAVGGATITACGVGITVGGATIAACGVGIAVGGATITVQSGEINVGKVNINALCSTRSTDGGLVFFGRGNSK